MWTSKQHKSLLLLLLSLVLAASAARSGTAAPAIFRKRTSRPVDRPTSLHLVVDSIPRGGAAATAKNPLKQARTKKTAVPSTKATPAAPAPVAATADGASIPSHVFNLIKSIVGAGVLGLPAGIAAFGNAPSAVVPALGLLVSIGTMAAYGFSVLGRLCFYTNSQSYRQVWERTVSAKSSWVPALCCLLVTTCSVLAYSMILSNTIPSLVAFVLEDVQLNATQGLLGITLTVLLPLCLLKNLKSLAPFSLLGIFGMMYTSLAMVVRYVGGKYQVIEQVLENGNTVSVGTSAASFVKSLDIASLPSFGDEGAMAAFSSNAFVLISMLSTAYMAHYNAPKFYWELKDASLPRFKAVVLLSFGGAMLLMATAALFGFLTFGGASQGLILNNYSTQDTVMTLSRFAVTLSLVFSYPLAFVGVRDGILDLCQVSSAKRSKDAFLNTLTVALLSLITVLALVLNDLRLLMAFGGATWGNCVIYLFPPFMMYQYCRQLSNNSEKLTTQQQETYEALKKELPVALMNGFLGLIMGCIGTVQAVQSI
jgi:amino acid permease